MPSALLVFAHLAWLSCLSCRTWRNVIIIFGPMLHLVKKFRLTRINEIFCNAHSSLLQHGFLHLLAIAEAALDRSLPCQALSGTLRSNSTTQEVRSVLLSTPLPAASLLSLPSSLCGQVLGQERHCLARPMRFVRSAPFRGGGRSRRGGFLVVFWLTKPVVCGWLNVSCVLSQAAAHWWRVSDRGVGLGRHAAPPCCP
jgi:hypothetical protein